MKSKIINKFLVVVASCATLTSCLELSPLDQLSDGTMWVSANDFTSFANNFYSSTRDFNELFDNIHSDVRSDLYTGSTYNSYSYGSVSIPTTDSNYTTPYSWIRKCNLLIENAEDFSDQDAISQPLGEAYYFRACQYFELLTVFGEAIIVLDVLDVDSPELSAPRNSREEVIEQIVSDLQTAVTYLPAFSTLSEGYGRVSQEAAWGQLARMALFEGTWQKSRYGASSHTTWLFETAIEAAEAVMNSNQFVLFGSAGSATADLEDAYRYLFILENVQSNPKNYVKSDNKEYIFAREYETDVYTSGKAISHSFQNNGVYISKYFADLFAMNTTGVPITAEGSGFAGYTDSETSEFTNRDLRMDMIMLKPGEQYYAYGNGRVSWDSSDEVNLVTCTGSNGSGYNNHKWTADRDHVSTNESFDFPIIRYAEVLLTYAEAVYELSDYISNADLDKSLNLVRWRSNPTMPGLSNELVAQYDLDMQTEIRRERSVEMFMEACRPDDIARWYIGSEVMGKDIKGVHYDTFTKAGITIKYTSTDADGFCIVETGRTWDDKQYLYPIPSEQLELNESLVQNPGWE